MCLCLAQYRYGDEGDRTYNMEQPEEEVPAPHIAGDWLMYLCGAPVQDSDEEKMARDN